MPTKASAANPSAKPSSKGGAKAGAKAARPAGKRPAKPLADDALPVVGAEGEDASPAREGVALKIKGLVDRVTASSGVKRKEVRTVIDAVLAEMGAALGRGEGLSLPGLGHLRVARKATAETPVMTLKLRQGDGGKGKAKADAGAGESGDDGLAEDAKEALAAPAEHG